MLQRNFQASALSQKRLADMAYVPSDEGWLYLTVALYLNALKLAGCTMVETVLQELTLRALDVALGWRHHGAGPVHHSDRARNTWPIITATISSSWASRCR